MGREVIEGGHNAHLWTNLERSELHLAMTELSLEREQVVALMHRLNPSWLPGKYNANWKHLADVWAGRLRESHSREWQTIARPYMAKGHKKRKPNLTPYTQIELNEYWRIRCNVHAAAVSLGLTPLTFKSGTPSLEMGGPQLGNQPPTVPLPHNTNQASVAANAQHTNNQPTHASTSAAGCPAAATTTLKRKAVVLQEQPRKRRTPRSSQATYYESSDKSDEEVLEGKQGANAEPNRGLVPVARHDSLMPTEEETQEENTGYKTDESRKDDYSEFTPAVSATTEDKDETSPYEEGSDLPNEHNRNPTNNASTIGSEAGGLAALPRVQDDTDTAKIATVVGGQIDLGGTNVVVYPADPSRATTNVAVPAVSLDYARNPKYKAPGTDRIYECEFLNRLHAPRSTWSEYVPPKQLPTISHLLESVDSGRKSANNAVSSEYPSYDKGKGVGKSFAKYGLGPAADEPGPEPDWNFWLNDLM